MLVDKVGQLYHFGKIAECRFEITVVYSCHNYQKYLLKLSEVSVYTILLHGHPNN